MKKLLVLLSMCMALTSWAVPQQINYQGYLTATDGSPLDTTVAMTFSIHRSDGNVLWTETHPAVLVANGLFDVLLGSVTPLEDEFAADRTLGITVGNNTMMVPRQKILSVANAYRVGTVDGASGGTISGKINVGSGNTNAGNYANVFGENNVASGDHAAVGGGKYNKARGTYSVIAGGGGFNATDSNSVSGDGSFIGGGSHNRIVSDSSVIGGGTYNVSSGGPFGTVAGGHDNEADWYSFVGGGRDNHALGQATVIGGGDGNTTDGMGEYSTISGGRSNWTNDYAAIGGGNDNQAYTHGVIGGGSHNYASTTSALGGGSYNTAIGQHSTIGGGHYNSARGQYSVVSGGGGPNAADSNSVTGDGSFIGGGSHNRIDSDSSVICGGTFNSSSNGPFGTVAGGHDNRADWYSFVGGGRDNHATGEAGAIGGGSGNSTDGMSQYATISGGYSNYAGDFSTVGGGGDNSASQHGTVGGGNENFAGYNATVPGGRRNRAEGWNSFAAGDSARVNGDHSFGLGTRITCAAESAFVWSDGSGPILSIGSSRTFSVKATAGTRIWTNSSLSAGVTIGAGGNAWVAVSDSTKKRDIRGLDTPDILKRFSSLALKRWEYKSEDPGIEHVGPMAQDFWNSFHLGSDSLGIATIDADGVIMAAIQELAKQVSELRAENAAQQRQIQILLAKDGQTQLKEEK